MSQSTSKLSHYLVINLGLRSIRAVLYTQEGAVVDLNWYPVRTAIDHDQVEQDTNEWWSLCHQLLKEIVERNPSARQTLASITVTSSACCLVALDSKGNTLLPSYIVSDKRASAEAAELGSSELLSAVFTKPNNLAVPSFMFPKILWIKRHLPTIFKKTAYFLSSNDFLLYKLSGKIATDPLNAEKFYFELDKKSYPTEVLKYCGVKKSQLPEVVAPGTRIGFLTEELQKQLGISQPVEVVVSTYDAICAFLGSGVSKLGQASNVCGTVTSIRAFSNTAINAQNGVLSQSFMGFHIVGGSNNIDGGLLEWSKQMFYGDSYPEKYVYRIMGDEAEMSQTGSKGLIFSPYIIGERLPFFDSTTRGIFFGLERFHTRSDIMRSILEASGYMANDIIQSIESTGVKVDEIRMSGGLTNTKVACSIRADITGKIVHVIDDIETTAMGAFFILLYADKKIKDLSNIEKYVKVKQQFQPNMQNHKVYKKFFPLFKHIHQNNKELMQLRKQIMQEMTSTEKHVLDNL